jgi:hypothetical protein
VEVPFGNHITDGESHGSNEDLMCPKSVEQEVVKHDDTSIAFSRNLGENFTCCLILRRTDCINHRTDGSHPEQVHHDGHHQDYH